MKIFFFVLPAYSINAIAPGRLLYEILMLQWGADASRRLQ